MGLKNSMPIIIFSQPPIRSFMSCCMMLGVGLCKPHAPLPARSLEKEGCAPSCLLPVPVSIAEGNVFTHQPCWCHS